MDAIVISGYLHNLNDNIIPFIKGNDVYIHTWSDKNNDRWIRKIKRYTKLTNSLFINIENPRYKTKLYSYFYSTLTAVDSIPNIDKYDRIVKFKPNLIEGELKYIGDLKRYFHKGFISSNPLLTSYTKEDCIYGCTYYKKLDERIFSGYPLAFKKLFAILDYEVKMKSLHKQLIVKYGEQYEGSIFWTEWCKLNNVPIITDTDLNIPNNKM